MFNGGVSRGVRPLRSDQNDFYLIIDSDGNRLPTSKILGLADLGSFYNANDDIVRVDGDNFIDICLNLENTNQVKRFIFNCDENTEIYPPKGPKYGPCISSTHDIL